ncbi:MAG: HAMP domain-containing sensor histidine kinase [Allomuricauda sp.]
MAKKTRLIQKTSRSFLWISFFLMWVSTIALYFYLHSILQAEVEEELRSTEARIETSLSKNGAIYQLHPVVEVAQVPEMGVEMLKDTLIYDPSQDELEEFRELSTYSAINGKNYKITVRALVVESRDILIAIVLSYLVMILVVFVFLFYLNRSGNQRLWRPFFKNLEQMKKFSLTSEKPISLVDSDILEFSELNTEISTLTDKVRSDYKNLKQYTEDVSHEMQTPLAIIQAKIENVINGDILDDRQFEHLTSILKDIQRLTQMTKRLTLLTKIENNQFPNVEKLDITRQMEETVQNFNDVSAISIKLENHHQIWVEMDPYLAAIVCNNLVSNAIKHACDKKDIIVKAHMDKISVANCGTSSLRHPESLYNRFYRESETVKSTGLGLAIVKRICDFYGFKISYNFEHGMHNFSIDFA